MKTTWKSRAVTRPVEAGNSAICAACDEPVKFAARNKAFQVIANVYENGVWNRVEALLGADPKTQPTRLFLELALALRD